MPESKASGTAYTMTRTQREDGDGSPGSDAFGMVTMFTRVSSARPATPTIGMRFQECAPFV